MSEVVEINDIEQLAEYRLLWNALLPQTRGATFFHTLDWLEAYWKHFGRGQKLRVLIVSSADTPIGIMPLTVVRERTRVGWIRTLTYPLSDWGTFYGPIGPNPAATLTVAMRYLRKMPRDWDLLDLRWTDTKGHDHHRTQDAMQRAGFRSWGGVWKETSLIDMDGTWDAYLQSRPNKFRNNLRRLQRRVERLGGVTHVRYRPEGIAHGNGDPRWDLYDQCVEVAQRSWQGSSTIGTTLSHASVREFFRDTHALAAKNGMLDVNLLMFHGRPVAFGYNYHYQSRVSGIRIGRVPEFASLGLGNLLYANTIRDGFDRGDRLFDLGIDFTKTKRPWLTRVTQSYRYTHYPLGAPRVQLLWAKRWLLALTKIRPAQIECRFRHRSPATSPTALAARLWHGAGGKWKSTRQPRR